MARETLYLIFVILGFGLASCSTNEDTDPEFYDIFVGDYELLDSSIQSLPYLNKREAIFIDSLGRETRFDIDVSDLFKGRGVMTRYDVNMQGDTVRYGYNSESIGMQLYNSELDMFFSCSLSARPYSPDPESGYIADEFTIYLRNYINPNSFNLVFRHLTHQRTWPTLWEVEVLPTFRLYGQEFENVIDPDLLLTNSRVFYSYEFGIVSFTDRQGKAWVLKSLR